MSAHTVLVFEERHIGPALIYRSGPGVGLSAGDSAREIAAFLARNPGCSAAVEAPGGELAGAVISGHDRGLARALLSVLQTELTG